MFASSKIYCAIGNRCQVQNDKGQTLLASLNIKMTSMACREHGNCVTTLWQYKIRRVPFKKSSPFIVSEGIKTFTYYSADLHYEEIRKCVCLLEEVIINEKHAVEKPKSFAIPREKSLT